MRFNSETIRQCFNQQDVYDYQTLSAQVSPVGDILKEIIIAKGAKSSRPFVQTDIFPDGGVDAIFYNSFQLIINGPNETEYLLVHDPQYKYVIIVQNNSNHRPQKMIYLPTSSEIIHNGENQPLMAIDFQTSQIQVYEPAKNPQDKNQIEMFYKHTRQLINKLVKELVKLP